MNARNRELCSGPARDSRRPAGVNTSSIPSSLSARVPRRPPHHEPAGPRDAWGGAQLVRRDNSAAARAEQAHKVPLEPNGALACGWSSTIARGLAAKLAMASVQRCAPRHWENMAYLRHRRRRAWRGALSWVGLVAPTSETPGWLNGQISLVSRALWCWCVRRARLCLSLTRNLIIVESARLRSTA